MYAKPREICINNSILKIIKYVPHGINEKTFYPLDKTSDDFKNFKKHVFGDQDKDFTVFYNARNLRRKSTPDLILSFKTFLDTLPAQQADKCALIMHTDPVDDNGTDLNKVIEMLFGFKQTKVYLSNQKVGVDVLNKYYNLADLTALISSNEGWGLSITESMLAGTPILANVTGGMQDQMRFEDENGKWIEFDENFCSNHFGTYKKHGEWAIPVFPSNSSLVGSPPTPYIWDDRLDFRDLAKALKESIIILFSDISTTLLTITPCTIMYLSVAAYVNAELTVIVESSVTTVTVLVSLLIVTSLPTTTFETKWVVLEPVVFPVMISPLILTVPETLSELYRFTLIWSPIFIKSVIVFELPVIFNQAFPELVEALPCPI